MVLDGSERIDCVIRMAMPWDTMGGVARRAWARNPHAMEVSAEYNELHADLGTITLPYVADDGLLERLVRDQAR
ncbi:MAG: hypothetical protein ABFC81_06125 [Rectinema sp.]